MILPLPPSEYHITETLTRNILFTLAFTCSSRDCVSASDLATTRYLTPLENNYPSTPIPSEPGQSGDLSLMLDDIHPSLDVPRPMAEDGLGDQILSLVNWEYFHFPGLG